MQFNFKKVLACTLSAAMVLTAAPMTGITANAAAKVKLSATKGTMYVGKTKKVTIKNTKKSNIKKVTFKYSKSGIVKAKRSGLTIKFTGKKKGTSTVTVKVTLKKAVAGKKSYTLKYKATVKKAAATKVAVTGVSLSNSTPKVGDTLTATVEPVGATNVTYAWYVGTTAADCTTLVEGATTATLKVDASMLGKFIKVQANGENDSSFNATTTAAVTEDAEAELAITAEQTGASKITVKANKAVASTDSVIVKRGNSTVSSTFVVDATGTEITITTGTKLADAEYTVTVTPADTKKAAATTTLQGKTATLEKIDFVGDNLVLASSDYLKASVKIFGYDSFGEKVPLSTLQPYTTKGTASYSASDNEIVISSTAAAIFTTGEQVTVTAVYQDGATVKQVAKALTVSNMASVAEMKFGELKTSNKTLEGKKVTISNMAGGSYYKEIEAKDQYGNTLTANDLKKMLYNNTTNTQGTLFATPSQSAGSYVYLTGFDTTADGKTIAKYKAGGLNMPGKQTFTYTAVGGFTTTDEIEVVDDPYMAAITLTVPELYGGKEAELIITAKDQYGEDVNLFDFVGTANGGDGAVGVAASGTYKFDDKNHMTTQGSSITLPDKVSLKVSKNTANKTVKFVVKAAVNTGSTPITQVFTVQSAAPAVANVQASIQSNPHPYGIAANFSGSTSNSVVKKPSVAYNFDKNIMVLDQYGANLDTVEKVLAAGSIQKNTTTTRITDATSFNAVTSAGTSKAYIFQLLNQNNGVVTTTTAVTAEGTYTAELWYDEDGTTATKAPQKLASKSFSITNAGTTYVAYSASLASSDKLLYVGATGQDAETISVTGKDAKGNSVGLDYGTEYTLQLRTAPAGITMLDGVIGCGTAVPYNKTDGEVKGTAVVDVYVLGEVVASVDVPYSNAPAVTKSMTATLAGNGIDIVTNGIEAKDANSGSFTLTKKTVATTTNGVVTDDILYVDADGTAAATSANADYVITFADQYGRSDISAKWGGVAVGYDQTTVFAKKGTLVVLNGDYSQAIPVVLKNDTTAATAITVTDEAGLVSALALGDRDVTVGAPITLKQPVTIAAGKKLIVGNGVGLTVESALTVNGEVMPENDATASGTLNNKGTISFGTAGVLGKTKAFGVGNVTVGGTGTWTLGNETAADQKSMLDILYDLAPTTAQTINLNKSSHLATGLTLDAKSTLNVASGVTLTCDTSATTVNGTINNSGTIALTTNTMTIAAGAKLVNTGTVTLDNNAGSVIVNSGTITDSGTITCGAAASIQQKGTATFSGGTKTTVTASKFEVHDDSATTFTAAPSGADFVIKNELSAANKECTITIGAKTGYFVATAGGTVVGTATDIATFTEAAPANPKAGAGSITIKDGTTTILIAVS